MLGQDMCLQPCKYIENVYMYIYLIFKDFVDLSEFSCSQLFANNRRVKGLVSPLRYRPFSDNSFVLYLLINLLLSTAYTVHVQTHS